MSSLIVLTSTVVLSNDVRVSFEQIQEQGFLVLGWAVLDFLAMGREHGEWKANSRCGWGGGRRSEAGKRR